MKKVGQQSGVYCLDQGWKFRQSEETVLPPTKNHDDVYGFSKGGGAKGPAAGGYDDSSWKTVSLPHDWVTENLPHKDGSPNQGYKERGIGWYRRKFILNSADKGKQILLEFEGMSADAVVYVNGTAMKHSFSGYNSFQVDMTDMANFGAVPNVIAIRIDASAWEGWWYEGAGIYRHVWLVKKSPVHIPWKGVRLRPVKEEEGWRLEAHVEIENSFETEVNYRAEVRLFEKGGSLLDQKGCDGKAAGYRTGEEQFSFFLENPKIWSPETPNLYEVRASVLVDGAEVDYLVETTGFRTIELKSDTGFWLNGENLKLKGFCNHQDHAGIGVAVPYGIKEYRMKKLKELGANAFRCAHNPDPEILDICDELGMMVMEENRTFSSAEETLQGIKGIVRNARNHPSVILYSVFNEEPLQGTPKGRRMAGRLRDAVRQMDEDRPVLGAFNGGYMEEEGAASVLDAVGINYNPGRYDAFHSKYPEIPLLGSETASAFMVRGEYETDWEKHLINSYDDECAAWGNTVREAWKMVDARPFVAGAFVWTGFDYRGEPTPFTWPSVATFFGTYDSCGFEKDACYFYQAFWKKEKMVHLVSPWCSKHPLGEKVRVMVISNCEQVEIFAGDRSVGILDIEKYGQNQLFVPYVDGELRAVGYTGGKQQAEDVQRPCRKANRLLLETSKPVLESGGYDAVAVNVSLIDEWGTVVPDADYEVFFEVENAAVLGTGNGDPNSHEPDYLPRHRLYHGKAQAILGRAKEDAVTVLVRCENGMEERLILPVRKTETVPYLPVVEEQIVEGWTMYHKVLDQMPKMGEERDANDRNSFEPVEFMGSPQPEMAEQLGKYGWYRTELDLNRDGKGYYLYFPEVLGSAAVYIDGEKMVFKEESGSAHMLAELDQVKAGRHILEAVVKNVDKGYPQAGILAPVALRKHSV